VYINLSEVGAQTSSSSCVQENKQPCILTKASIYFSPNQISGYAHAHSVRYQV